LAHPTGLNALHEGKVLAGFRLVVNRPPITSMDWLWARYSAAARGKRSVVNSQET
jgi:hypothetical protein